MQKGKRTRKVNIIPTKNEGVSPVFRNNLDRRNINIMETMGLSAKMRLIFPGSFKVDLPAIEAPIADAISHEPRNTPVISS